MQIFLRKYINARILFYVASLLGRESCLLLPSPITCHLARNRGISHRLPLYFYTPSIYIYYILYSIYIPNTKLFPSSLSFPVPGVFLTTILSFVLASVFHCFSPTDKKMWCLKKCCG